MPSRRFLLMHVSTSSGHHHASLAVGQALRQLDPDCQIMNVDAFDYTTRVVREGINRTYLSLILHYPDVWDYLYDNPAIHQHVQHLRTLIHRYHVRKLQDLLETTQPSAIACTQAFPCGMLADFKRQHDLRAPLVGILTDYAPHLYWLHDTVDAYVVPAEEVKDRFVSHGIPANRLHAYGIPVEPRFLAPVDREAVLRRFQLDSAAPLILVMGGGSGFGPIQELVQSLDAAPAALQLVVLCGTNQDLHAWLTQTRFRHRILALGYSDAVPELMASAVLIITKPGGLTTAETLAKGLPMLMFTAIPGQEQCNARYLLSHHAAVQLPRPSDAGAVVTELLGDAPRLAALRRRIQALAHPESALDIARHLLRLAEANG